MQAELMQQMSQIEGDESTGAISISGSSVGQIVGLGSNEIGSAVAAYKAEVEEAKRIMDESLASGKVGQSAALKRQHQNLIKQKETADLKAANLRIATEALLDRMRILEQERNSAQEYNTRLNDQLKKLADLERNATQQDELTSLKNLVSLNETLRSQEAEFKESCKAQLQELKGLIAAAQGADMDEREQEEDKKLRDIEEMHNKVCPFCFLSCSSLLSHPQVMAKYNRLRALLAQTNLDLARNVRIIDDVPTRSELIQYERRFVELYQQVAWKLDETKKYYSLYNTLDTTLTFIQKEVLLSLSLSLLWIV
jgi:DNA repair exonuclease SbcCD ATPase subunit